MKPQLLDRPAYVDAITQPEVNHLMRSLADEIKAFDMKCDLLVCGFDVDDVPFILDIGSPGIASDMTLTGFQAIGSGWDKAVSRLLFSEHKCTDSIARVLYDCFDAKANAEMVSSVGYEWDAVVITGGKAHDVPKEIKELLEAVWGKANRSPFEKFDRKEDQTVPRNWQEQLEKYCNRLVIRS